MSRTQLLQILFLVVCLWASAVSPGAAQSDTERLTRARYALDQRKDCRAAEVELNSVSMNGRNTPVWIYYMARMHECSRRYSDALRFYRSYDRRIPGKVEILNKIAELGYLETQNLIRQREEQRKRAERAARYTDLSGIWDRSGTRLQIIQSGSSVVATYLTVSPGEMERGYARGHTKFTGVRNGNEITGTMRVVYLPSETDDCEDHNLAYNVRTVFTISEDGSTLEGTRDAIEHSFEPDDNGVVVCMWTAKPFAETERWVRQD